MRDLTGREIKLQKIPRRIISLVPSQTELLIDLGLEKELLGITKFCVHPENLRKNKQVVGGTKKVNIHKIKDLQPEIILCNKEENTPEMVAELEKIAPVHVSDIETFSDALEMIRQYGEIFDVEEKAEEIIEKIKFQKKEFETSAAAGSEIKVAYVIWKNPWMVAGKNTFINELLRINKFKNVFLNEDSRYPVKNTDEIFDGEAEIIFLSTEPFPFQEKHKEELQKEFGNNRIIIVDGEFFSWYGSRLINAFQYFRKLQLHS